MSEKHYRERTASLAGALRASLAFGRRVTHVVDLPIENAYGAIPFPAVVAAVCDQRIMKRIVVAATAPQA
jgi:hypothetical protein